MPFIKHEEFPETEGKSWSYERKTCHHPEHNPPGMIVLKPGIHTYQCPACGEIQTITIQRPELTLHSE